jgi:tRNA-splicing ligase RtcB
MRKAKEYNSRQKLGLPAELSYLPIEENIGREYIEAMNWALEYAKENRAQMMNELIDIFRMTVDSQFDIVEDLEIHHNFAAFETHFGRNVLVHRKGATRAYKNEFGIIPGSMGAPSYITRGKGDPDSFMSSSHGAGRTMGRNAAIKKFGMDDLKRSMKGVVANLRKHMLDEIPLAYKDIDAVMKAQEDLVKVVYRLVPLASVKG